MARPNTKNKRKTPIIPTAIVLAVIVVVAVLELTNTTHLLHKAKAVSGSIPSTNAQSKKVTSNAKVTPSSSADSTSSRPASTTPTETAKNQIASQQSDSQGGVVVPFGTFVSNHHPNLGNSPAPSKEQSACQTSPGASCYIKFTNSGITKTLPAQTADQNGIVIWNWDVKDAGFTAGSWQITAVASQGSSTQSANDPQNLEVEP